MKERVYYFDFLNVIACMAMLALHHNLIVHRYAADSSWWQALIVEVVCYWAVPVFFMLSGATLMRYRERYGTREFFIHRFNRAVVPFLIWSLVWVALLYVSGKDTDLSPFHIADGIVHTTYQPVYWFFIPLFGIYLLMPVLSMLRDCRKTLIYLAVLIFVVTGVIDPLLSWAGVAPVKSMQNAMAGPVLFAILGFLYKETRGRVRYSGVIFALAVACWCLRYFVTLIVSQSGAGLFKGMFGYYYFTSIIPAIAVFVLVKDYFPRTLSPRVAKSLTVLSSCSLGIYLLHIVVLTLEQRMLPVSVDSLLYRVGFIPLNYLLCFAIVYLTKRIPVIGRYLFP
ncbi:MAG: acyltransferase [Pseudoflavonifractor sp.]|nr:acyltransferase [Pseudoflavonifractor sp.]